jgi:hypothetical protein
LVLNFVRLATFQSSVFAWTIQNSGLTQTTMSEIEPARGEPVQLNLVDAGDDIAISLAELLQKFVTSCLFNSRVFLCNLNQFLSASRNGAFSLPEVFHYNYTRICWQAGILSPIFAGHLILNHLNPSTAPKFLQLARAGST